jgi:hypothetical protein
MVVKASSSVSGTPIALKTSTSAIRQSGSESMRRPSMSKITARIMDGL